MDSSSVIASIVRPTDNITFVRKDCNCSHVESWTSTINMHNSSIHNGNTHIPVTFMTLPREVRYIIYGYVLIHDPIIYKPRIPSFCTMKANALIFEKRYTCYDCRRRSKEGICYYHEHLWFEHKGFWSTMLEPTPSPYSILFANKTISDEFLRQVYKLTTFTFDLGKISTKDFAQWDISNKILSKIEFCRFRFDMNDRSLVEFDPRHRELHVASLAYGLPSLRRMEAAMVLRPGMHDGGDGEEEIVIAEKGQEKDGRDWKYNIDDHVYWRMEKKRLINVFEIPVEDLCRAPVGQQCYLIS